MLRERASREVEHDLVVVEGAVGLPVVDAIEDLVAGIAGTCVTMLETTYHHLLETSADAARARLDAFADRLGDERASEAGD
jgi:hypothetical protein